MKRVLFVEFSILNRLLIRARQLPKLFDSFAIPNLKLWHHKHRSPLKYICVYVICKATLTEFFVVAVGRPIVRPKKKSCWHGLMLMFQYYVDCRLCVSFQIYWFSLLFAFLRTLFGIKFNILCACETVWKFIYIFFSPAVHVCLSQKLWC